MNDTLLHCCKDIFSHSASPGGSAVVQSLFYELLKANLGQKLEKNYRKDQQLLYMELKCYFSNSEIETRNKTIKVPQN